MKSFIVLSIVSITCVFPDSIEDFRELDSIHQELPCARQGGMCTVGADCMRRTDEDGLCPRQKMRGVECCYGFSVRETRCRKRGGACFVGDTSVCSPSDAYKNATDCPTGTACCIFDKPHKKIVHKL